LASATSTLAAPVMSRIETPWKPRWANRRSAASRMRARVGCDRAPLRRAGVLRPRLPPVVIVPLLFCAAKENQVPARAPCAGFWPTAAGRATTVEIQRTFN
jgi:hypothetical protein